MSPPVICVGSARLRIASKVGEMSRSEPPFYNSRGFPPLALARKQSNREPARMKEDSFAGERRRVDSV